MIKRIVKCFLFLVIVFAILFVVKAKLGIDGTGAVSKGVEIAGDVGNTLGQTYLDHEDEIKAGIAKGGETVKDMLKKGELVDKANQAVEDAKSWATENGVDEKAKEVASNAGSGIMDFLKKTFNFTVANGNVIP